MWPHPEVFSEFVDENNVDSEGNPMIKTFRTGQLHRVPHHIYQKFIRAPKTNREEYLMDAIDSDLAKKHQVIIFRYPHFCTIYIHDFYSGPAQLTTITVALLW